MLILGISPLDKDSTVSLHDDGKITWAIGEERRSVRAMTAAPWSRAERTASTTSVR